MSAFRPLLFVIALACPTPSPATAPTPPSVVPLPARMEVQPGRYRPGATLRIATQGDPARVDALRVLAGDILQAAWQRPLDTAGSRAPADLTLTLDADAGANPDGYTLRVDERGIRLRAAGDAGLFHGLQTLRQLLADGGDGIAHVTIDDAPRFAWRGLHLDVARHLFPMDYIKRQLELMARYKFNVLHWHLTDDQGWRLEIKRYPKLTEVGAWRAQTALHRRDGRITYDGTRYGGFYTQAQAREIVEYARRLHITVVPEIEMPGHTVAVQAAYPELACTPGPFQVRVDWGVDDNVVCPGEATFTFIENVLDEVMAIFPSEYIHLGGDEAPIVRWQQSPLAQEIIRREGLKDEHALQGWFMRRVERYLQQHGRRMLAWDEMLAGDPAKSTTIMAWRSIGEGIEAARRGHDVVMTPVSYSYFDYCQSRAADEPYCPQYLPLRQVYAFEPVPAQLTPAQAAHVRGGQANLWTEHIRTPQAAEYMLWPRALAMSEVLWSARDRRDWDDFAARLGPQLAALGRMGVNYRVPEVLGLDGDVLTLASTATLALRSPLDDTAIVVTTDGSEPTADSPRYAGPLALDLAQGPVQVAARLLTADGRLGPTMRAGYARTTLQPAAAASDGARRPGLQRDYFEALVQKTDDLPGTRPTRSDTADVIDLPDFARQERFGLRYRGVVRVPTDAVYRFSLASDDGARLWLDDTVVIDRDGPQSPGTTHGSRALARGAHGFELRYFQGGGDRVLALQVSVDSGEPVPVPRSWWSH
ncbi:family 20 glycosylhydrolase [Stenotrophomonas acidaminiphila]|uniref:family 20 glycosylhydrolase n=1 Tax=Stenotrophomonas acidaminiphila TaxID=128780 RepID=UPI002898074F|nr:family 20 glycosylhydrolase [Stenotrophomonas acidaminiphila]